MTTEGPKPSFTPDQVKDHVKKIQEAVEQHKRGLKKGDSFTAITPEEIEKKLKRVNSPMIVSQGWGGAAPGGTVGYSVGIYNPDPTPVIWLFVHVWVGTGNVVLDPGMFLLNVDTRFPRLTQTAPTGFSLAAGASTTLNFALNVPATVEKTGYIGNSCLMRFVWHDPGTYLDRGVFVFNVA